MYKYIALDFDGTLLGPNHDISDRSVKLLKRLQAKGIKVILCSGRNISQMNFVAEKIECDKYLTFIVSDNGGVVTEIRDGRRNILRNAKFGEGELSELLKVVNKKTKLLISFNDGKRYLKHFNFREMLRAYIRFGEISKLGQPKQASKVLLVDDQSKIESIYNEVKTEVLTKFPHLNVFRSVPTLIEITPQGSTKGMGLELAFEIEGWDLKDLIVFGDGENDISMFQVAGKAIAMANAFDTVKAEADEICLSNAEDGVAEFLEKIYAEIL